MIINEKSNLPKANERIIQHHLHINEHTQYIYASTQGCYMKMKAISQFSLRILTSQVLGYDYIFVPQMG